MDRVDEVIGRALAGGPKTIRQLMEETGLSRATVFKHLRHLHGLVLGEPMMERRRGRPALLYKLVKPMPPQPTAEVVLLTFAKLKHACKFEKGGWCKKLKKACTLRICPLRLKRNKV